MGYHNGMLTSLPQSIYPDSWVLGKSVVIMTSHWTKPESSFPGSNPSSCFLHPSHLLLPLKGRQLRRHIQVRKPASSLRLLCPSCTIYFLVTVSSMQEESESNTILSPLEVSVSILRPGPVCTLFILHSQIRTVPGIEWVHKYL